MIEIKNEINELAGFEFFKDGKKENFEDMTRQEQIHILNAFAQGYNLFKRFLKTE